MKKYFIPALLFTLFTGSAAVCTAQDHPGPSIAVSELSYDLGKVKQGVQAAHVFEIRNNGTATLVIDKVAAS